MVDDTITFNDGGKCIRVSLGHSEEYNYTQDGNKIIVAGGGGADGMVFELSEDGNTAILEFKITEEMEQSLGTFADYILSMQYTYQLKM